MGGFRLIWHARISEVCELLLKLNIRLLLLARHLTLLGSNWSPFFLIATTSLDYLASFDFEDAILDTPLSSIIYGLVCLHNGKLERSFRIFLLRRISTECFLRIESLLLVLLQHIERTDALFRAKF